MFWYHSNFNSDCIWYIPQTKYITGEILITHISVASCTEGWPQWYRVARSSSWYPERWETKGTSRWTGNGPPATVTTTWWGSSINATSSLAFWDREYSRSSLPLDTPSQVHWIDRNIRQVPFALHDIEPNMENVRCEPDLIFYVTFMFFTDFIIESFFHPLEQIQLQ